jgi:maltooligosyltrehalose trehalohydrolase
MGEEWGATTPWQYFTSHPEPDLADAVVSGRRREFAAHGWPAHDVPNPQDEATFVRSKLDWSELENPVHQRFFQLYRTLIALRKATPDLADPRLDRVAVEHERGVFTIHRGAHQVVVNLSDEERLAPPRRHELVFATEPDVQVSPDGLILPPETAAIVRLVG